MDVSPIFLRARTIAFSCIASISLLWIVLLCLEVFWQWSLSDRSERSLILVLLLTNTITVIMVPILILRPFRPWLDAARFLFLLVAHIGTASAFAYWNPKFICPTQTADQQGVCKLLNMYILIASWVIPVLLVAYVVGLALMVYRRPRQAATLPSEPESELDGDEEARIGQESILPLSKPDMTQSPATVTFPAHGLTKTSQRGSHISEDEHHPETPRKGSIVEGESRFSTSTAGRLSKRLPAWYF